MYNILAVECYMNVSDIINQALSDATQYNVVIVDSGYTALEAIKLKRFDMAFIENDLPYLSGLKTARALRRYIGFERTPFVILVPELDEALISEYAGSGVADFIEIPLKSSRIKTSAEAILKNWKTPNDNIKNYIDFQRKRYNRENRPR